MRGKGKTMRMVMRSFLRDVKVTKEGGGRRKGTVEDGRGGGGGRGGGVK